MPAPTVNQTAEYSWQGLQGDLWLYKVEVTGQRTEVLIDGSRGECVALRLEQGPHKQDLCFAGPSWELVRGDHPDAGFFAIQPEGLPFTPSLTFPSPIAQMGLALAAGGRTWHVSEEVRFPWYGGSAAVVLQRIDHEGAHFQARLDRYGYHDRAPDEADAFRFHYGSSSTWPKVDSGVQSLQVLEQEAGQETIHATPAIDWARQMSLLVPVRGIWPDGSGCVPSDLTPEEAVQALASDGMPVGPAPRLLALTHGTRQLALDASQTDVEIALIGKDGKAFAATLVKSFIGGQTFVRVAAWTEEAPPSVLHLDQYPTEMVGFCTLLDLMRSRGFGGSIEARSTRLTWPEPTPLRSLRSDVGWGLPPLVEIEARGCTMSATTALVVSGCARPVG